MIICRTPFRISFFGGGTDYPKWFEEHGGAVLATTIDKYCYITVRYLPPFFEHRHRIIYSKMEYVKDIASIEHPSVRECLRFMKIDHGVEIHHDSDLPARTGLGSSSAFTVGLLNALYALNGKITEPKELFQNAILIEQRMIGENVGCQDQAIAAHGGFNYIQFSAPNRIEVSPIPIKSEHLSRLADHLMLFYTGRSRTASEIAAEQIHNIPQKTKELNEMFSMAKHAKDIVTSDKGTIDFGRLLHESWLLKRSLSSRISTPLTDQLYELARNNGAIGGKLLGAGGGGFLLIFAKPEDHNKIRGALKNILCVPVRFEPTGSRIVFYQAETKYAALSNGID